jgi:sugar transferase (PEP-CTERM/EpsH1 system associated)
LRIVFVTPRFPYPVEKGDKLRAFHQIKALSKQHEIHLVAISHRKVSAEDIEAMQGYCRTIKVFQIKNWLLPIQLFLGWMEGLPLQVSYFLDRTIKRKVQYHIIHLEPDHVICQLIRAAPYVRALPFAKTLDYMDVFSEGMVQLAKKYRPFGFVFQWEAKRLAAYERTVYKDFDKHTIISGQDRNRLKLATHDQILVVPNGVDDRFAPNYTSQKPSFDIVFVGNLGYGPNRSAVDFLVKKVYPALKKRGKTPKILIAGARPGPGIEQLGRDPGIVVRGWVEDIRDAYADGRIFVAPMFSGLGLQNKILEAMAMGLPCVTTSMVNNAIGAGQGTEILVADTLEGLVDHVQNLMENEQLYNDISRAGRAFILKNYQWEDQVRKLETFIGSKNIY